MYKTFVYHENASGLASFTRTGDAWAINNELNIFAVADSPLRYLVRDTKDYPFDDYGLDAAQLFCDKFLEFTEEIIKTKKTFNTTDLYGVFIKVNQSIKSLNMKIGKKYNDKNNYDLAETVGVGAVIFNGKLFYGGLEDCYVNILRGGNLVEVQDFDNQTDKGDKYLRKLELEGKLDSYHPESLKGKLTKEALYEPCWCNYLRNNINAKDENGDLVSWGCFTGEKSAENFIQIHETKLEPDDKIILFSDGMIPVFKNKAFLKWVLREAKPTFYFQVEMRKKISKLFKDKLDEFKEKTMIYVKLQ